MTTETMNPTAANAVTSCKPASNGKNYGGAKELMRAWSYVCPGVDSSGRACLCEPIIVRWYAGRSSGASRVYCTVWVHPPFGSRFGYSVSKAENPTQWDCFPSGTGWAGGGYDKYSASFDFSIGSAGFALRSPIDGRGMDACRDAVRAIADYMGLSEGIIVEH